jgi:RNA 3'-terminal phosphate cyclase (ATP)
LAALSGGTVQGGEIGSQEIVYYPGAALNTGAHTFDVGTAGSTTLLAFALIVPALFAGSPSRFTLIGGLFQDFAPTAFHLKHCLVPLLNRMGAAVTIDIVRPGYVPKGQGRLRVEIQPPKEPLRSITRVNQGSLDLIRGISLASHLSDLRVSQRMAKASEHLLREHGLKAVVEVMEETTAVQRGAALLLWVTTDTGAMIGSDMAGAPGRSSERIAGLVTTRLIEDLQTRAALDRHLADQIVIFAALAEGVTTFRVPSVTDHVQSNLWLVREILGAKTEVAGNVVTVEGVGFRPYLGHVPTAR